MDTRLWRGARLFARLHAGIWVLVILSLLPAAALAAPYADYVIDARTGEVLHQENAETRLHPASLTKMMTLYIAFEAIKRGEITLDTPVTISRNAAAEPPSKLGLRTGQKIALRYLIRAAAVKSANDAATAIGEAISGSEAAFADRMNATAKALGMTKTTFRNANGLTRDGHLSTARDMAILGRSLFYDHPEYYNLFSRRSTHAGSRTVYNTNRRFLDAYPGADGIKTGFTNAAGFNLVGSAHRGNKRIIASVFGGKSTAARNARMAELLDLGFRKAPANAPVRKPAPPDYRGLMVARGGAVEKSPRPGRRTVAPPPDLLIALKDGIETALGDAQVASASLAPVVAGGAAIPAVPVPAERPDHLIARAAPEAPAESRAEMVAEAGAPDIATDVTLAAAGEATEADTETAPETLAVADTITPDALTDAVAPEAVADAIALAGNAQDATPTESAEVEIPAATAAPEAGRPTRIASAPPPRPEAIELASLSTRGDPTAEAEAIDPAATPIPVARPAGAEVVTRRSSEGGRLWAINLGRYPTRFAAEGALLKTALAESRSLTNGLRKVTQRSGGFDAQVVGLNRDQADLACRRIQARNQTCFTVSP